MIGQQRRGGFAIADRDRLEDLDRSPRLILGERAGTLDQMQKRRRAAIHDRHFWAIELDNRIVDAAAGERRHQMLDRADADAFAIRQHCRQRGFDRVLPAGADLGAGIEPAKDDAAIRRCRTHRHDHLLAAMQPHPSAADRGPQGPLLSNPHVPQHVDLYQTKRSRGIR